MVVENKYSSLNPRNSPSNGIRRNIASCDLKNAILLVTNICQIFSSVSSVSSRFPTPSPPNGTDPASAYPPAPFERCAVQTAGCRWVQLFNNFGSGNDSQYSFAAARVLRLIPSEVEVAVDALVADRWTSCS